MIRIFFLLMLFSSLDANSQDLKKINLTKKEKSNRILSKYVFEEKQAYNKMVLLLYLNGTFEYTASSNIRSVFSIGKWKFEKGNILLNSDVQKDDLPVTLNYSNDTSTRINGCKINIIKNLSGDELADAFVLINNDSIRCLPSYASCYGRYSTIDSVKVVLENGISSQWIKVRSDVSQQIEIVVQMKLKPSMYLPIANRRYRITKKFLKEM